MLVRSRSYGIVSMTVNPGPQSVQEMKFREDLYFSISTFHLRIPSLRERPEDIPVLANTILRNLAPAGKDSNGHPIVKADRTKVTIQDVIAAEGPRLPGVDKSQREFNTGIVIVVQHGEKPSPELIERAEAIRKQWIDYFSITTGHRASMTANPR